MPDAHVVDTANRTMQLAWLAGLFEGEGYSTRDRGPEDCAILGISMTDEDVIRRARAVAGGIGRIYGPYQRGRLKPMWQWRVQRSQHVGGLLMTLYPLLGSRRQEQFRAVLASWRAKPLPVGLKPRCIRGHPLSGDNLCAHDKRHRRCRICTNERSKLWKRAWRAKRRAVNADA